MDGFSEMLRSCYAACAEKSDLWSRLGRGPRFSGSQGETWGAWRLLSGRPGLGVGARVAVPRGSKYSSMVLRKELPSLY